MKTQELGTDHTGTWTAHQYVIDAGYDRYSVDLTAQYGVVGEPEQDGLSEEQQQSVVDYCRDVSGKRSTIDGHEIMHDESNGQGHKWVRAYNVPPNVIEEIAAEIIDGKNIDCDDYVASNGCHYRW